MVRDAEDVLYFVIVVLWDATAITLVSLPTFGVILKLTEHAVFVRDETHFKWIFLSFCGRFHEAFCLFLDLLFGFLPCDLTEKSYLEGSTNIGPSSVFIGVENIKLVK